MNSSHAPPAAAAERGDAGARMTTPPTVRALRGRIATAAWGAPALLAPFLEAVSDPAHAGAAPAAELWFGAHAARPSPVAAAPAADGTAGWIAADRLPAAERPPVLVKLLAAGAPLSIQVHPDDATAATRAPEDPVGKPELLRALGPMRILCGLRPAAASRTLLSTLAPDAGPLLEALGHGDEGLGEAVALALRADRTSRAALLTAVEDGSRALLAAAGATGPDGTGGGAGAVDGDAAARRAARLALELLGRFPGDPGVLVALLLEDVDLAPGASVFVAPGTPHAYLSGLGLEVMPPSDQVLRGGLTVKPIDVEGFLGVLDAGRTGVPATGVLARRLDGAGWRRHVVPSDAFVVDEADVDGRPLAVDRTGSGAGVLVCVAGAVHLRAADGSVADLAAGTAALLAPGGAAVEVDGRGAVVHATGRQPGAA